jgi:hypothetical protein
VIEQARKLLREKGYTEAQLDAYPGLPPDGALLKGTKIVSPFSDSAAVVLRVVTEVVPPAAELGRKQITPRELRERLGA